MVTPTTARSLHTASDSCQNGLLCYFKQLMAETAGSLLLVSFYLFLVSDTPVRLFNDVLNNLF